ncbi:MAG: ATP-binding protein [Limisphaerales bacterium]
MVALESIELFRNLGREELQALRMIARERHFAAQSGIFKEGDPGDGAYFVKDGLVEISSVVGTGRRTLSRLGPGEVFGEMAVIEHRPRSATATAARDTDVYFLPRGEMLSFIQRSPALAFGLLQYISRRLRDFDQLYLREVVQAERLAVVGNFARSIVHDLKNPLAIISLSAETFDRPEIRPEARAQAQARIRKMVERIGDMVSDILIFTDGKRTDVDVKPASYHAYVMGLLADLRAEAESKDVRIQVQNEPPPVLVRFNPRRLSRVFYNLIHNAADMTPAGGVIYLRFRSDGKEIVTEIEDTGPGIAPEIADKLFETFATFGKEHGTGLGLSICKKIIADHQGRIWARNEPGRGAVFAFALPLP